MVSFQDWYINIEPFIQSSEYLHLLTQSNIDVYSLLPPLWQAMTPYYKGKYVSVLQQYYCTWIVKCLVEMKTTLGVAMGDMSSIQLGI